MDNDKITDKIAKELTAEKESIKTLRDPYYETSDGIEGLTMAVSKIKDPKLGTLVKKLSKSLGDLRSHMDKNYIWD